MSKDVKQSIRELEKALEIEKIRRQRDEARQLVAEANNSLYGSHGYFHSLNGGSFDKYHLSRGIENLKAENNRLHTELSAFPALQSDAMREALDNSQSLLVAMLNEQRPVDEIERQIAENREALSPGFFNR